MESADADTFAANDNVTFINWGNIRITKINKKDGKVESVDAKLNLDDKDFKKTTKVTWLAEHPKCNWTPAVAVEFDNIITKPILEKDDDFKNFINRDSRKSEQLWGDHQLGCTKEYFFFNFHQSGGDFFRSKFVGNNITQASCVVLLLPGPLKEKWESGFLGNRF